jgi:hypothetical protein
MNGVALTAVFGTQVLQISLCRFRIRIVRAIPEDDEA